MKIMFMGTPQFAVFSLESLINSGFNVSSVVTKPDAKKNRGQKVLFSAVKECANKHNIPLYQPQTLKDGAFIDVLNAEKPDIIVVVAFGMILPKYVLDFPKYGCVNVHASLLPKYRGAAPIQRCIMDGETKTGVTIMKMDEGLDTGDMILWDEISISQYETASQLHDRLAVLGGRLVVEALKLIEQGKASYTRQDEKLVTYAKMIEKKEGLIDFSKSKEEIINKIRAIPCYAYYNGKMLKIISAIYGQNKSQNYGAGEIVSANNDGIFVAVNNGEMIVIKEIQPEGGKKMPVSEFLKGNKIEGKFD